jgi:hypothetical protein
MHMLDQLFIFIHHHHSEHGQGLGLNTCSFEVQGVPGPSILLSVFPLPFLFFALLIALFLGPQTCL